MSFWRKLKAKNTAKSWAYGGFGVFLMALSLASFMVLPESSQIVAVPGIGVAWAGLLLVMADANLKDDEKVVE